MITTQIAVLTQRLAQEEQLRTIQSETKAIETTLRALEAVATQTRDFASALETCSAFIAPHALVSLRTESNVIARDIEASRQRFTTNRKEQLPLHSVGEKLKRAQQTLTQAWRLYLQQRLAPYVDLLRLVNYLPEVSARAGEIQELVAQLQGYEKQPPRTQLQVDRFHQQLDDLGRRLDAVAQLPASVRLFLSNVLGGTATLADVTPEVQRWIEDGDRARAFRIQFTSSR